MTEAAAQQAGVMDRFVHIGEVRLHVVEAGSGPLVILLHGFPEFCYSWRHQIPALTAAGYRVVAPDMRGYNLSDKPKGAGSYRIDLLAHDVTQLIEAYGEERAIVVGHDWGAAVAWQTAMLYPERVDRLVTLNTPHPERFIHGLRTLRQLRKSWYMFFFQLPWLPEMAIRAGNFACLRRALRTQPVRSGAFREEDIQCYVEALTQPGALTAGINYYRALLRQSPRKQYAQLRRIEQPVLVIWGVQDRYLGAELAKPNRQWVPNVRVERLPDASHWIQVDHPERVNKLLIDFLDTEQSELYQAER